MSKEINNDLGSLLWFLHVNDVRFVFASYFLHYLYLFAHSGVFVLFFSSCVASFWIFLFSLPLQHSLAFLSTIHHTEK
jgi:hypothetical protein